MTLAIQYGDRVKQGNANAAAMLAGVWGPIPRYLIDDLSDEELGLEIKRRWLAKRVEQSPRNLLDMRLLGWLYPERVQDHWQSVWTGKPIKKLRHNADQGLSIGLYNWTDPLVRNLMGVLAGNEPMAYELQAKPRDWTSEAAALHADIVEEFCTNWRDQQRYDRTFMDGVGMMVALGRNWKTVLTDPDDRETEVENIWPGHVAAYWKSNMRDLEQVIVAKYLTAGEAVDMYPDSRDQIERALQVPSTRTPGGGIQLQDDRGWLRYTVAVALTLWYRTKDDKIGNAVCLLGVNDQRSDAVKSVLLDRQRENGYTDIPLVCTPLMKYPNRPPDESQGILYKIAPINTEFNEVVSATRDMLYRAFYPTWYAKGFTFRSGPRRIGRSSVLALPRADQAIGRIDDQIQLQGAETFAAKLEQMMVNLGVSNRWMMGDAPPSQMSGAAIDASINALATQIAPIRKNMKADELWVHYQVIDQQNTFGQYTAPDGTKIPASLILDGTHQFELRWIDTFKDDTKQKQLALAGLGKVHGLDYAQHLWGIPRRAEERRRMAKERMDIVMFPANVSQTANAIIQKIQAQREQSIAATLAAGQPLPKAPVTRVTLSGLMSPEETSNAAQLAGIKGAPPTAETMAGTSRAIPERPGAPGTSAPASAAAAAIARRASAASAAAAAPEQPVSPDGAPPTGGAPAALGDMANPVNASPMTGTGRR